MTSEIRLLIVGAGRMAQAHAKAFAAIPGVAIAGAVDPDRSAAAALTGTYGGEAFASVEEALDAGYFHAAANVTPDAVHHATTLPLLRAGKHVLCEKPLATSAAEAAEMARLAAAAGVVHMVNLTYRRVPALQQAAKMVAAGALGQVRHVEASYLQSWLTQDLWGDWRREPAWLWRLSSRHGSKGVLGDIGIHILDFAGFAAGDEIADVSCRLATFDKAPGGRIGDYVLDANDSCTMLVGLAGGAIGTVTATRFASGHINDLFLRIYGDKGGLEVAAVKGQSRLRACLDPKLRAAEWVEVEAPAVPDTFTRFIAAIRGETAADPDFHRGAALQRVLDRAEASHAQGGRRMPVV
ncbi:MAG: Gfo/Idh/MocA family oxidoreductase [Rhodobacter sp.]|nr:Gfo/Idh/MocA family oxidoreductase [Rhodobacter sp.]